MDRAAAYLALILSLSPAYALPLKLDGWAQPRHEALLKWLNTAGASERPCSRPMPAPPPSGVKVLASTCAILRGSGEAPHRERKLRIHIAGARWRGLEIASITYQQQYALKEQLVYHDTMQFDFTGVGGNPAEAIKAWWRERGLAPKRDGNDGEDIVEGEAGIEWVKPVRGLTRFSTEFYE